MAKAVAMCAVLVLVVVVIVGPSVAVAAARAMTPGGASAAEQQCNPAKLIACKPAVVGGAKPSESCCSSLKAQEGCFCQYAKDPAFAPFINSPNALKPLTSCGIAVPTCPK